MKLKLSRGLKKHIRRQKAMIRREVADLLDREKQIKQLVERIKENYLKK